MTGAEWFAAAPGGLNRYFTDLYTALAARPEITVSAAAFGAAPAGATSWGPTGGGTVRRAAVAAADRGHRLPRGAVLDRHFALYGPARRSGPVVVHFHGPWAGESRAAGAGAAAVRAKYVLERLRYRGADRFVVLSRHFRDLLVDDYGVPADRVVVIPPGIDTDRYTVGPATPAAPTVLCVRRLEHRMGIDRLLRAWPAVLDAHPGARLTLVGTGTAEAELRALATALDPRGTVTFTGRADDADLARRYRECAVTVVPSVALEGFGLIALESLASGRAPIVTDCGGLPDSVRGLDPSLIVPAGDSDALAARLVAALDGGVPDAARCRAHARTFSWAAAAAAHAALYQELAG
ncbi:glycosyltransferase family 4 protein [Nocardia thailandica]|uniref:glycosyltransferase family 4 protein n=1 Tax=Nocardia thailandica TaxID=257275 RepID=UPI0005B9727A|nr:glycosyltransferase family 4 protein [Nocardia thailandica]